jgi:hypothetical protein
MTADSDGRRSAMKPGEPYSPHRRFLCAPVPLWIMAMLELSFGAKLLFGRLALYAGPNDSCYPSLRRLAADMGTSINTICRLIKELVDAKLIRRKRCGPGKNARIEFVWHPALGVDDSPVFGNQDSPEMGNQEPDSPGTVDLDSLLLGSEIHQICKPDSPEMVNAYKEQTVHINGSLKRTHTQSAHVLAADLDEQASPRFEEAWAKWPGLKARKNPAAQMWVSVVPLSAEAKVFECLERFLASDQVARGIVGYFDNWLQQQHADSWEGSWPAPRVQQQRSSRQQEAVDGFRTA